MRAILVVVAALAIAGCGGGDPARTESAPATEATWTAVPPGPLAARHSAVAAWVDGRFVVVGGRSGPPCPPGAGCAPPTEPALRDGAALDPATGRWTPIAAAPVPVTGPASPPVVAGGRVYVLTGTPPKFLSYDPAADRWQRLLAPPVEGGLVAAGDTVLVVPFQSDQGADAAFDPRSGSWRRLPRDPLGPSFDRYALWLGDRLLLSTKQLAPQPGARIRLATLDAGLSTWSALPDTTVSGDAPVLAAGRVLWPYSGAPDRPDGGGILDPASGDWQPLPTAPWTATPATCCTTAVGDRVLVGGHLLQPASREWTRVPAPPGGVRHDAATAAGPDVLLIWGGGTGTASLPTGLLLRVSPR